MKYARKEIVILAHKHLNSSFHLPRWMSKNLHEIPPPNPLPFPPFSLIFRCFHSWTIEESQAGAVIHFGVVTSANWHGFKTMIILILNCLKKCTMSKFENITYIHTFSLAGLTPWKAYGKWKFEFETFGISLNNMKPYFHWLGRKNFQ